MESSKFEINESFIKFPVTDVQIPALLKQTNLNF